MSAFIVQPKHIDYLLSFANQARITFYQMELGRVVRKFDASVTDDLNALGQVLTAVNVASVNFRYRENTATPKYTFRFYRIASNCNPVQVLKACDCYDYQSCELNEYNDTFAKLIVDNIRAHAIKMLPGYDSAQWEIVA